MKSEHIIKLVQALEPLFLGYVAEGNRLKNENGMELAFLVDWKNKTTVKGLHASRVHSIGCSFNKATDKIFKDVRKRLFPDYYKDFFETKKERIERSQRDEEQAQKLKALASVIDGEICSDYGHSRSSSNKYVNALSTSIHENYYGNYEFNIVLDYIDSMKLASIIKESFSKPSPK